VFLGAGGGGGGDGRGADVAAGFLEFPMAINGTLRPALSGLLLPCRAVCLSFFSFMFIWIVVNLHHAGGAAQKELSLGVVVVMEKMLLPAAAAAVADGFVAAAHFHQWGDYSCSALF
jgi:hypothetical protein